MSSATVCESRATKRQTRNDMDTIGVYACQQASCRASLLVASGCFSSDDWEDLRQEMVLDYLQRSPKFDPSRGDWHGFVRGVMRNQASDLVMSVRRRGKVLLGADLIDREDASDSDPLDFLDTRPSTCELDALHVRIDVRRIIQTLPPQLQSLAVMLGQSPTQQVCKRLRRSRSQVCQMIRQIRKIFVRAGFSPEDAGRFFEPGDRGRYAYRPRWRRQ